MYFRSLCLFLGCLLWACIVHAQYTIVPVQVPFAGASVTTITGVSTAGAVLGTYLDMQENVSSFVCAPTEPIRALPLLSLQAISPDGETIAGQVLTALGPRGFVLKDGTTRVLMGAKGLEERDPVSARVVSIGSTGLIAGDFQDDKGLWHGFTFDTATETATRVDIPFAHGAMGLAGVTSSGLIVGWYSEENGFVHGFIKDGLNSQSLDFPGATRGTQPTGVTDSGLIVGIADDQGFLYQGGTFTPFTIEGATITQILGIRADGTLFGRYLNDTLNQGFLAFPQGIQPLTSVCVDIESSLAAPAPEKAPKERKLRGKH